MQRLLRAMGLGPSASSPKTAGQRHSTQTTDRQDGAFYPAITASFSKAACEGWATTGMRYIYIAEKRVDHLLSCTPRKAERNVLILSAGLRAERCRVNAFLRFVRIPSLLGANLSKSCLFLGNHIRRWAPTRTRIQTALQDEWQSPTLDRRR